MKIQALVIVVVLTLLTTACGSNSSPTAPTESGPPNVAGNYSGTLTFSYLSLGRSAQCPASTSVNQNGSSLSIAPIILSGACASLGSLPAMDGTVTTTGSLGNAAQNGIYLASCNGYYNGMASGGFFGSTLQFSLTYTAISGGCVTQVGSFTITGNLNRS